MIWTFTTVTNTPLEGGALIPDPSKLTFSLRDVLWVSDTDKEMLLLSRRWGERW